MEGEEWFDDEGEPTLMQMERVYSELHAESVNAALSSKELAKTLHFHGTCLALEVLRKLSVVELAVAYRMAPHDPLSSNVIDIVAREFPSLSPLAYCKHLRSLVPVLCRRYADIVSEDNWVLLSILAHSRTFRTAAFTLNRKEWESLVKCIKRNEASLEVFAKVRGLDFKASLVRVSDYLPLEVQEAVARSQARMPHIDARLPHGYVVACTMKGVYQAQKIASRAGKRDPLSRKGVYQIHVDSNIYNEAIFTQKSKPDHWPKRLVYPADPTTRPSRSWCLSCFSLEMCDCHPLTCSLVSRPLVELTLYDIKGIGVRALQRIESGDILGEYVGELWPAHSSSIHQDAVYSLSLQDKDCGNHDVANIVAKKFGNWTRYINHSCRPSTDWQYMVIGKRYRMMIKAIRNIEMFEELTIHYGDSYFENIELYCYCGEPCCRYSKDYKKLGKSSAKHVTNEEWGRTIENVSGAKKEAEDNQDFDGKNGACEHGGQDHADPMWNGRKFLTRTRKGGKRKMSKQLVRTIRAKRPRKSEAGWAKSVALR